MNRALPRPLALLDVASFWDNLDGGTLTVACSGGADSTALALAASELLHDTSFMARFKTPPRLVLWHLDHGLRADSHAEAAFVRELTMRLDAEVVVETAELASRLATEGGNMEAEARRERYDRLLRFADQHSTAASCVVLTAHHLDDQAETVLHHILRGTHLTGLRGIAPIFRGVVHRPWLTLSRAEILVYLEQHGQHYMTDPTNADVSLTRNRLRHEVLPLLRQINPRASEHIARLTGAAREAADLRAGQLAELEVEVFDAGELAGWLPLLGWPSSALEVHRLWPGWHWGAELAAYAAAQAVRRLGTLSADEHGAINAWAARPDSFLPLRNLRLELPHPELLCLHEERGADEPVSAARLARSQSVAVSGLQATLEPADARSWSVAQRRERRVLERIRSWPEALAELAASPPERPNWQCFLGEIELPLTLRTWRPGERIRLAGGGSKTLGDAFTDAKLPEGLRPIWAVLADGRDEAIWVPGLVDGAQMQIGDALPRWLVTLRAI